MSEPFSRESRPSIYGEVSTLFDAILLGDESHVNTKDSNQQSRTEEARLQLSMRVLRIFELELRDLVRKQVSSDWFFRLIEWFKEDIDAAISWRIWEVRIQGKIPEIMVQTGDRVRSLTSPIIEVLSKKGMEATIGYSQRVTGQLVRSQEELNKQIQELSETKTTLEKVRGQSAKNRAWYDRSSQLLIKATRELTQAKQKAAQLADEVSTLTENLELWKTASEAANTENARLRQEHSDELMHLNEQLRESREQLASTQAELESARRTIESQGHDIWNLRLDLARAEDRIDLLGGDKADLEEMVQQLTLQLEAEGEAYQDLLKMMPNKDLLVHQRNLVSALGDYFYILLRKKAERRIAESITQTEVNIRLEWLRNTFVALQCAGSDAVVFSKRILPMIVTHWKDPSHQQTMRSWGVSILMLGIVKDECMETIRWFNSPITLDATGEWLVLEAEV